VETKPSVCPLDCPDRCALDVDVDGGRAVRIDGSERSELTAGFICAKVRAFGDRVGSPRRILHPMRRSGPKGSGRYERISWDEAIALVAGRFADLARDPGPESILPFHYDGSNGILSAGAQDARLWNRLGASELARTFCAANANAGWAAVFGDMPGSDPLDVRESDAIVLWGVNPSVSGIHLVPLVRRARKAGAFLAVVDPVRTPLARESDLHLPVQPGADTALALGMIRVAHDEGLVDRDFVRERTRGWDALLAATPSAAEAAATAGVSLDALRALPRAMAKARAPFFRVGWGLERNRNGVDSVRAVLSLRAALGRFSAPGAGVALSTSGGYILDRKAAQGGHLRKRPSRTINMSELGKALEEARNPEIRALYVYNANPVATAPNQARVIRAMSRDSLFTVVHEQLWTDTCDYADVVLPATTFLEHADLLRSYGGYALQWSEPVIPPAGEAKSNHELFSRLANALGFTEPEFSESEVDIARSIVKDFDQLRKDRIRPLKRPRPFVDVAPSRGFVDLAGPSGPPRQRAPVADADLPLIVITPASDKAITSQLFETEPPGGAKVLLAPAEAARRGLRDGEKVRLRNSLGEVHATLSISDDLPPGVASIPKGLWREHTLNRWTGNVLAPDHVDEVGGGACYNDARAEIERA
jgi:anaerobic selenocysteine-containing dehydrogenase